MATSSVILNFEKKRYLFNCSEGFQRYIMEHKVSADRLTSILMTRPTTDATGGLAGFLLSMSSNNVSATGGGELIVRGPPKIKGYVDTIRTYANVDLRGGADFKVHEFNYGDHQDPSYEPEAIESNAFVNIFPVVLRPAFLRKGDPTGEEPPAKRARTEEEPSTSAPTAPPFCPPIACYICELATVRGKFHPKKAQSLGVPVGPLFARLANGESVTSVSGATVTAADVCDPASPGPIVLVIDCPSELYVDDLLASAVFRRYTPSGEDGASASADGARAPRVACVVHLGPWAIVSSPRYAAWMQGFAMGTKHLVVHHPTLSGVAILNSTETLQRKLGHLDRTAFPELPPRALADGPDALAALGERVLPARNLLKFILRPAARQGLEQPETKPVLSVAEIATLMETEHKDLLEQAREGRESALQDAAMALPAPLRDLRPEDDFQLVFLGTGAAMPSKYRNVSGLFLDLGAKGCMMIDCGEGSLSQLIRRYGPEGARDKLRKLRSVWISHFHADHHGGLAEVMRARQQLLQAEGTLAPLLVLGPRPLLRTLQLLGQVQPTACTFVDNYFTEDNTYAAIGAAALKERSARKSARGGNAAAVDEEDEDGLFRDPLTSLGLPLATEPTVKGDPARTAQVQAALEPMGLTATSVRVFHCPHAFALVLEHTAGWKIVYSGDTRPCPQLVRAAEGATLLIHEATFDDGLKGEAVEKRHSITREAVRTGSEAKVYRTMLTHFSQRYPKVPKFDKSFRTSTCIAFDLMTVSLRDLPYLPSLLGPIAMLFKDEVPAEDKNEMPVKI